MTLRGIIMVMQQPHEEVTAEQVLELVDRLPLEGREKVLYALQLADLRREIQKGIDSADRGDLTPAEEVLDRLRKRAERRLEEQEAK